MKIALFLPLVVMVMSASARHLSTPVSSKSVQLRKNKPSSVAEVAEDAVSGSENDINLLSQSTEIDSFAARQGALTILGGVLAHLSLGTLYCWANFMSYAPSNLKFFDGLEHKGSQPDSLIALPVTIIAQCFSLPIGPLIQAKLGASRAMLLGCWIMAAGVYLASYANNLTTFLLFAAVMFGLGAGVAYTAPMVAGYKWLPQSKGLVSGVILAGYGAGGFIFNIIGTKIANPKGFNLLNGRFPDEVYNQFPKLLRILAVIYASLAFVGSFLVSEPKKVIAPGSGKVEEAPVPGVSPLEALKTHQFWLLWVMMLCAATAGLNVASIYKQFAAGAPALAGDSFQSLVGASGAFLNGVGRLFWGVVSDKIGFKNAFFVMTALQAVIHALYPLGANSKPLFLVLTSMCYFCLAGSFSMTPPAMQRIFGPRNGAMIYGLAYSAFGVAGVGGSYLTKALLGQFGWAGVFKTLAAMTLIATGLSASLTPVARFPGSAV